MCQSFVPQAKCLLSNFMGTKLKHFTISTLFALVCNRQGLTSPLVADELQLQKSCLSPKAVFWGVNLGSAPALSSRNCCGCRGWHIPPPGRGEPPVRSLHRTTSLRAPRGLSAPTTWGNHPQRPQGSSSRSRQLPAVGVRVLSLSPGWTRTPSCR